MLFGAGPPPDPMGNYTGFLLNWVAAGARGAFARALEQLDLRPPQFAALVMIDAAPGMAQQDLVNATGIDPSTMVAMLDALEAAGLAERRPDPDDRRKRAVYLTAGGRRKLAAACEAATAMRPAIFGVLDDAEYAQLHRLLRKLAGYTD